MESTCTNCNKQLEPSDLCKCKGRCEYCREWIKEEPAHLVGCKNTPKTEKIIITKNSIEIGQKGDTNEDTYYKNDYGYYLFFPSYQTRDAVEKLVEYITKEADG